MNKLKSIIFIFSLTVGWGSFKGMSRSAISVARMFIAHGVVPDVIPKAPPALLKVIYSSGVKVEEGNELTPTQVKDVPKVSWDAKSDTLYTLCMVDPDSPSRTNPVSREWHHWLVGNIHGNKLKSGEVLSQYIGSGPPRDTGLHRYVFLVYQQKKKINFTEPRLNNTSAAERGAFSLSKFVERYHLGDPVAGNFFMAQYDDYVVELYREIYT